MGTDIHMWAEVRRKPAKPEGAPYWEKVAAVFKNPWHRPGELPAGSLASPLTDEPYDGRNYNLFAMLADVRNGTGFAGCVTGKGFIPIDEPRGLPKDLGWDLKERFTDAGYHSVSWLTLDELKAYDWEGQATTLYGWVGRKDYQSFKDNGVPDGWSGGVSGGNVKHISNEEMEAVIAEHGLPEQEGYHFDEWYTQVEWKQTYAQCAGSFLTETIPALEAIAAHPDALEVRIVFGFDS